jgi:hypothetical protein
MQRCEKGSSVAAGSRPCGTPNIAPVLDFNPEAEGLAVSRRGDVFAGNIQTGEVWLAARATSTRHSYWSI